jgi:threonine/homoserine/homoserine lactone efflux protein
MASLFAFLLAAIILAITPGPGMAYVAARTIAGGRTEGLASCLGTALGGGLHVAAAALGVSVLLAQSAIAFSAVKYIGALYLIYLGLRILLRKEADEESPQVSAEGPRRAFIEGIVVEALNVKTALFFLAFLPQFVSPLESPMVQLAVLGTVCVALNTTVDVAVVFAAERFIQVKTARVRRARILNRISGITMLLLGTYLALAKRQA